MDVDHEASVAVPGEGCAETGPSSNLSDQSNGGDEKSIVTGVTGDDEVTSEAKLTAGATIKSKNRGGSKSKSSSSSGADRRAICYGDHTLESIKASEKDLSMSIGALKRFWLQRVYDVFANAQIPSKDTHDVLGKFDVDVVLNKEGDMMGTIETYYLQPESTESRSAFGKALKYAVDVLVALECQPAFSTLKQATPEQCFLMAREDLERTKVAQLLGISLSRYHGRVDDISLDEDDNAVAFVVRSKADQEAFMKNLRREVEEYGSIKAAETERYYQLSEGELLFPRPEKTVELRSDDLANALSVGTTTLLDWGRLVPEAPAFNTTTHLYPLGFKCIRFEYDANLQSVVQCMCEIDVDQEPQTETSRPVFRVTVSWVLNMGGTKRIENKVYEGTNPRQVWDAIAGEDIGGNGRGEPSASDSNEVDMLKELIAKRERYLTQAKVEGTEEQDPPRIVLGSHDDFVDPFFQRLFEGLEYANKLQNYTFSLNRESSCQNSEPLSSFNRFHLAAYKTELLTKVEPETIRLPLSRAQLAAEKKRKLVEVQQDQMQALPVHGKASKAPKVPKATKAVKVPKTSKPSAAGVSTSGTQVVGLDANVHREFMTKAKDVEREIRARKEAFTKVTVKSNLNEAKRAVHLLASEEERSLRERVQATTAKAHAKNLVNRGPQPLPSDGLVALPGGIFTEALEVWEFLCSYSHVLRVVEIPSIDAFCQYLRLCDPSSAITLNITPVAYATPALAVQQLNKIASLFCELLVPEYERIMNIDVAAAGMGAILNSITWQEIARTVLVYSAYRDTGFNETDTFANLRGKGYTNTPDHSEKKLLGLIRKRMVAQCLARKERYHSGLAGFHSGVVARLPNPSQPGMPAGLQWRVYLTRLVEVPDNAGWLVTETVRKAILAIDGSNRKVSATVHAALSQTLTHALNNSLDITSDAGTIKAKALAILAHDTGSDEKYSSIVEMGKTLAADFASGACGKLEMLDLLSRHNAALERVTGLELKQPPRTAFAMLFFQEGLYTSSMGKTDLVDIDDEGRVGSGGVGYPTAETKAQRAAMAAAAGETGGEDDEDDDDDDDDGDDDGGRDEDGEYENPHARRVDKSSAKFRRKAPWRSRPNFLEEIDDADMEAAVALKEASKRAFFLVRELMQDPLFNNFNFPVDPEVVPHYYAAIPQPLCLYDLRRKALKGGYDYKLSDLYKDIMIMIENAIAYNAESSPMNNTAVKAGLVFERMYLEKILFWKAPLENTHHCHACRRPQEVDVSVRLQCERCDSVFHLDCVNPRPSRIPKGDWMCPNCQLERGVEYYHPNKDSVVEHPFENGLRGLVVGIEQTWQQLHFTVAFDGGKRKEVWSGRKVREQAEAHFKACELSICKKLKKPGTAYSEWLAQAKDSATGVIKVATRTTFNPSTDVPESFEDLYRCSVQWIPEMPSGYDIDDIDLVSCFVRGYVGYGCLNNLVPVNFADSHSFRARELAAGNPVFEKHRKAIAALSPHSPGNLSNAEEWVTVLRALMQMLLSSSQIVDAMNMLDREASAVTQNMLGAIKNGVKDMTPFLRQPVPLDGVELVTQAEKDYAEYLAKIESGEIVEGAPIASGEDKGGNGDDDETESDEDAPPKRGRPSKADRERSREKKRRAEEKAARLAAAAAAAAAREAEENASLASTVSDMIVTDDEDEDFYAVSSDAQASSQERAEPPIRLDINSKDKGVDLDMTSDEWTLESCKGLLDQPDGSGEEADGIKGDIGAGSEASGLIITTKPQPFSEESRGLILEPAGQAYPNSVSKAFQDQLVLLLRKTLAFDCDRRPFAKANKDRQFYCVDTQDVAQLTWELKRYSRYKGMDDALVAQELLEDILKNSPDLDLTSSTFVPSAASDGSSSGVALPDSASTSGTATGKSKKVAVLYDLVQPTLIKICMPRMSDAWDMYEWMSSFNYHMRVYLERQGLTVKEKDGKLTTSRGNESPTHRANKANAGALITCAFCNLTESALGSHFVHGQTFDEWEDDLKGRKQQRQELAEGIVSAKEMKNLAYNPATSIAYVKFRCIDTAAPIQTALNTLEPWLENVDNGYHWQVTNDYLKSLETSDVRKNLVDSLHFRTFMPRKGSLVTHEHCMEEMCRRRLTFYKSVTGGSEESTLVQILSSIGRGKTMPLGYDKNGARYWIFAGCPYLVVSVPPPAFSTSEAAMEIEKGRPRTVPAMTDSMVYQTFVAKYFLSCGLTPEATADNTGGLNWFLCKDILDVGRIMLWLDQGDKIERQVHSILAVLFPKAEACAREAAKKPASAAGKRTGRSAAPSSLPSEAAAVAATEANASKPNLFDDLDVGTAVVVANGAHAIKLKWAAVIVARATVGEEPPCVPQGLLDKGYSADVRDGSICYRVRFDEWRPCYSCWVSAGSILKAGDDAAEEMIDSESSESEGEPEPEELAGEDTDDNEIAMASDDEEFKPAQHLKKQVKEMELGRKEDASVSAGMGVAEPGGGDAIAGDLSTTTGPESTVQKEGDTQVKIESSKSPEPLELEYGRLGAPLGEIMTYAPDPINHMSAWRALLEKKEYHRPKLDYSACTPENSIAMVRYAMLTILHALPPDAFDPSEERWGDVEDNTYLSEAWMEAVMEAKTATDLMGCELMLEYGIKNSYRKNIGCKVLTSLSSRFLSLRRATIGLVAMRVWVLDASLKYTVQVERQKKVYTAPVVQVEDAYSRKFGVTYLEPEEDDF